MSNNNKNFISYGYSSFIASWQQYYQQNFLTFFAELEELKTNLDSDSKEAVDNLVTTLLFKLKTPAKNYLIKKDYLYSAQELQQIKKETISAVEANNIRTKYKLNPDFILQTAVFKYHNGLKLLPKEIKNLIKNKIVLDCGAYYGDSALVFNKYQPSHIYTFEPSSINFKFLQQTIKNNNLQTKITPINKGVGDRNTITSLYFNSYKLPNLGAKVIKGVFNSASCSHFSFFSAPNGNASDINNAASTKKNTFINNTAIKKRLTKNLEPIELITLDSFVANHNLQDIALIKLDIEGLELDALLGAKNTIKTYKPIILAAIYHNAEEFLKTKPFLANLVPDYNFLMCPLDTADILKEFYLIAYPKL